MKLSGEFESDNVKAAEEFLDKLIIKEVTSMGETPLFWNSCLKGLSSIRGQVNARFQGV